MKKILVLSLLILSSCASLRNQPDEVEVVGFTPVKNDLSEYAYLESSTGVYNGRKSEQEKLVQLQKEAAEARLAAAREITYTKSEEEKIEQLAEKYISDQKWKMALDILIKYEPILTHNKNLTNQLIFASLKLEYYDFAIDQLLLALQQKYDPKVHLTDYFDKQVILAHTYYLADKYKQAEGLYTELYQAEKYPEAPQYLFLLGYKQKDLDMMNQYLEILGKDYALFIDFNILTAQAELAHGQESAALRRMKQLFDARNEYENQVDLTLSYAHLLIQTNQMDEALQVLDAPIAQMTEQKSYHFMRAYIYFHQGDKQKFQKHLALTNIDDKYKKELAAVFINKSSYGEVFNKVFQQDKIADQKLSLVVKESAEKYTFKYINKPQFKDAVLVREEYRPVTEPIRLPASLEFDQSK